MWVNSTHHSPKKTYNTFTELPQLVIGYAGGTLIVLETENDNFHYKKE